MTGFNMQICLGYKKVRIETPSKTSIICLLHAYSMIHNGKAGIRIEQAFSNHRFSLIPAKEAVSVSSTVMVSKHQLSSSQSMWCELLHTGNFQSLPLLRWWCAPFKSQILLRHVRARLGSRWRNSLRVLIYIKDRYITE